ncbi:hypothetical protein RND81_07G059000 [Saponaria officinalis]|uniref:Uncharacterized protein n=1 Tax=Saponaria officinalis TaxID=3572 RepID=A0AAW1JR91_SAPOF
MAQSPSITSGNEEKNVSRVNSFTKFLRSPSRPKSMKKSSSANSLTRFFNRKSSKKGDNDEGEGNNNNNGEEEVNAPSLIEEVKEVVGSAIHDALHHTNKDSTDAAKSTKSGDSSSIENKNNKPSLLDKFKEEVNVSYQPKEIQNNLVEKFKKEVGETKEEIRGDFNKAKEQVKTSLVEEVKASTLGLGQKLKDEVVGVVNTTKDDTKKEQNEGNVKGVEKKKEENGCVSTLAQGLEKLCAPWSSTKKEE